MTEQKASRRIDHLAGEAGALEVVTYETARLPRRADLLFVHGAWSSSWYWQEHFMPWLAARGYRCRALSLRGHGGSDGKVRWASITDYVTDVALVAQGMESPVIIGHSMGGFVAQKYAEKHPARAVALLAPVPPSGAWSALGKILTKHPKGFLRTNLTLDLYGVVADPNDARALLFSRDKSHRDEDRYLQNLQSESFRAFLDMLFLPVRTPIAQGIPVVVIGAERDQIISQENLAETAKRHGAKSALLPQTSHMLMVDDRWEEAAFMLESWISTLVRDN
jgi:pimeloyl-ACP methyl ester carboxylesterase